MKNMIHKWRQELNNVSGLLSSEHDEGLPDIALVVGEATRSAHILDLLRRQVAVVCQESLPRKKKTG